MCKYFEYIIKVFSWKKKYLENKKKKRIFYLQFKIKKNQIIDYFILYCMCNFFYEKDNGI